MKFSTLKQNVLQDILVRLTFDGAFQRANLYNNKATDKEKKEFRRSIAELLPITLREIQQKKDYSDNHQYAALNKFSKIISSKHFNILKKGKLKIGNAQKFLNLYWKVSWLLKKMIQSLFIVLSIQLLFVNWINQ